MKKPFRALRYLRAAMVVMLFLPGGSQSTSAAGSPSRSPAPSTAPRPAMTAILLVAQGVVSDPNFGGSIVVVMNNVGPAPIGIILNRPMPLTVSRFFPKLKRLAPLQDKVYFGGPVEFGTLWYLFRARTAPANAIQVCDGVYVSSDEKLLNQLLGRAKPLDGLRLFIGHAGWAPGQLQAEISGGAWVPRRADADSIFNPEPQLPWPSRRSPKAGT